jgi:hypothetical protein
MIGENLLGATFMQGESAGQRVGCMVRNPKELADCRDVGLAARPIESLGDIEDEVGTQQRETSGEAAVGFEPIYLAHSTERSLHRVDGGRLVPLGVQVWLREVGSEGPTGRLVGLRGVGVRPGSLSRRLGFEIEGESDPNCQMSPFYKKGRPRETSQDEFMRSRN